MDTLTIIAIALIVLLVAGWIFYNRYTQRIIDDLVAENAYLDAYNSYLRKQNNALTASNRAKDEVLKAQSEALQTGNATGLDFPNSTVKDDVSDRYYAQEVKKRCY